MARPRTRTEPGDSSGVWQEVDVGNVGEYAGLKVPAGSGGLSGTVGGSGRGFGPPRLEGSGACVRLVSTSCGLRVMFVGIRTEDWLRVERAGTGFRSGVWGPADSGIKAKVLPPSGQGTEVGFRTLSESAVLVGWRLWVEVGLSEALRVPGEAPGVEGSFRAGVNLGTSAGSPVLVVWLEGSVLSTTLGLCPAPAPLGAESHCIMGDGAAAGRASSETEETESVCLGARESAALGLRAPAAPSSLTSTAVLSPSLTSRRVAAAERVSMVTSRVRGVASLGVVAWLVSVS